MNNLDGSSAHPSPWGEDVWHRDQLSKLSAHVPTQSSDGGEEQLPSTAAEPEEQIASIDSTRGMDTASFPQVEAPFATFPTIRNDESEKPKAKRGDPDGKPAEVPVPKKESSDLSQRTINTIGGVAGGTIAGLGNGITTCWGPAAVGGILFPGVGAPAIYLTCLAGETTIGAVTGGWLGYQHDVGRDTSTTAFAEKAVRNGADIVVGGLTASSQALAAGTVGGALLKLAEPTPLGGLVSGVALGVSLASLGGGAMQALEIYEQASSEAALLSNTEGQ